MSLEATSFLVACQQVSTFSTSAQLFFFHRKEQGLQHYKPASTYDQIPAAPRLSPTSRKWKYRYCNTNNKDLLTSYISWSLEENAMCKLFHMFTYM